MNNGLICRSYSRLCRLLRNAKHISLPLSELQVQLGFVDAFLQGRLLVDQVMLLFVDGSLLQSVCLYFFCKLLMLVSVQSRVLSQLLRFLLEHLILHEVLHLL